MEKIHSCQLRHNLLQFLQENFRTRYLNLIIFFNPFHAHSKRVNFARQTILKNPYYIFISRQIPCHSLYFKSILSLFTTYLTYKLKKKRI